MASPGAFGENCCALESGNQRVCLREGGVRKGGGGLWLEVRWEKLGWHPKKMGEGASKVSNCEREVRICLAGRKRG